MWIDPKFYKEDYIQSSGPGGQNVNKVATAVQLRFDVKKCTNLTNYVRNRLLQIAKNKINDDGILLIEAKRFRTQDLNRKDAHERLQVLLVKAAERTKKRRKTKPTKGAVERRIKAKKQHSEKKRLRKNFD